MSDFQFDVQPSELLQEQLTDLWLEVSRAGGAIGFTQDVEREEVASDVSRFLGYATNGSMHLITASKDDGLAGCCVFVRNPVRVLDHWMELKRFMVHPKMQGTGFGSEFVERAVKFADTQLGLERVQIQVRGGDGLEIFWAKCGFTEVARIPGYVKLSQTDYRDAVMMIRPIPGNDR